MTDWIIILIPVAIILFIIGFFIRLWDSFAFDWLSRWKRLNNGIFPSSMGLLLFVFIVAIFFRENKALTFTFKLLISFIIVIVGVWIAGEE